MESQRLQRILKETMAIEKRRAIEKARAVKSETKRSETKCCGSPANNQVQLESSYLDARISACPVYLRTPVQPESVRINALIQSTINAYGSPTDPAERFVEYKGPFILPPCPPVDPNIFNASQGFRQIICPQPRNYYSGL